MSVRANWHLANLPSDADDDPMSELLNVSKPIDLSTDVARLSAEMSSLIRAESAIWERTGVSCELKDRPGWTCQTCPHRRTSPRDGVPFDICQIGLHQHEVLDQLQRHSELEELEAIALQRILEDECEELAEVVLPEEELVEAA